MKELLLSVHWLVPVVVYILASYVGQAWLRKYLANQPDQLKRLLTNFSLCALIAVAFAALTGNLVFNIATFTIMGVGVLNGLANIVHWRANKVSMSKTSLLSFGDDVIAILLAMLIVGDAKYLNWTSGIGMMICLLTGVLFWWHHFKGGESTTFYRNVLVYSVLWGVCDFSLRYYAKQELPVPQFLLGWYTGAWVTIGSIFLYRFYRPEKFAEAASAPALPLRYVAWSLLFAVSIMVCLSIEYWARMLAPQTVVQPILLVSEAVIPTIVGVWIFKERSTFDRAEWGFAILGVFGTILLAIGFSFR